MLEPQASVVAGAAAGSIPAVSLVLLGAQVDALIVGLIAAIFVSIWLQSIDDKLKSGSAVLLSAMLAGYGSPAAATWVVAQVPTVASVADTVRLLLALVIGATAPFLIPLLIKRAAKKVEGGDA